jgi:hypothetical protein
LELVVEDTFAVFIYINNLIGYLALCSESVEEESITSRDDKLQCKNRLPGLVA